MMNLAKIIEGLENFTNTLINVSNQIWFKNDDVVE